MRTFSFLCSVLLMLLFIFYHLTNNHLGFEQNISTILACIILRFISFGSIHVCRRMPYMLPVYQRIFKDCGDGVSFDVTKDEFNGRYYQAACNLQAYSARVNPYHLFMTYLSKGVSGMQLLKYLQKKAKDPLFVGMFPLHSCLNHDCYHNVDVRDGKMEVSGGGLPGIMMIANRDIKKDEELMTTYINPQMSRKVRRAWLFKSFNFWCQCQKCKFEGDDNSYCTECEQKATNENSYPMCGKCKKAYYCSLKCQKSAWRKGHKAICQQFEIDNTSPMFEIDNKLRR